MRFLIPLLAFVAVALAYESYDGYKVLEVIPQTDGDMKILQSLEDWGFTVDFWKEPVGPNLPAHLMVLPSEEHALRTLLGQMPINVYIQDVQKLVNEDLEHLKTVTKFNKGDNPKDLTLNEYHSHQEINDWLDSLAAAHPDIVSVSSLGMTFENRDMKMIKIGLPSDTGHKRGFWIDAGIHAREWVAPATAIYIINELVTKYTTNNNYKQLVDSIDFYILPSFNADGYEYSRDHSRLWRKTRTHNPHSRCRGVDPNRNFPFHFGGASTSSNPCSEIYRGTAALTEPSCRNVANFVQANNNTLKAVFTLHSYGEYILVPWGWREGVYPPDFQDLKHLADQMHDALQAVHGTDYTVGQSADVLYAVGGASDDWSKSVGVKFVYTVELRPGRGDHDDDHYGFQLPARFILRSADEAWAGLLVAANRVMNGPV